MISGAGTILKFVQQNLPAPKPKRQRRRKYNHPKRQGKAVRILNLIEERGGMTVSQIQRTLWEWAYPGKEFDRKIHRGFWGTNLYGSRGRPGLLHKFCTKQGRRWVRNSEPHNDKPFQRKPKGQWSAQTQGGLQQIIMSYMPTIQMPSIKTIIAGVI